MDPWKIDENLHVFITFAYLEATWHPPDASGGTMECPACLQEGSASLQECPVDPQMSLRRSPRVSGWSPKVSKSLQKVPQSLQKVPKSLQKVPQSLQKVSQSLQIGPPKSPEGTQRSPESLQHSKPASQQSNKPTNQQASSQQAVSSKRGRRQGRSLKI